MKKLLFLDFDGVLFDTAVEAFHVSFKVYFGCDYNPSVNRNIFDLFKQNRYLVAPAWHYFYLLQAIELNISSGTDIKSQFRSSIVGSDKIQYGEFESSFFKYRKFLRENTFEHWISLHDKYPFFDYVKSLLTSDQPITCYILSTKDEETIKIVLMDNGVDIPAVRILGKSAFDNYGNKANVIKSIMADYDGCEAIFIDDSVEHLEGCKEINQLTTIQNDWGYIDPEVNNICSYIHVVGMIEKFKGEIYECT